MANDQAQYSTQSTGSNSAKANLIKRQVAMVFSAYRRDEFADPEGFIAQLGAVLEGYADEIIVAVTSPRTGIQRRLKWPPSIAEMAEACDAEAGRLETQRRYSQMPRPNFDRTRLPPDTRPGRLANVFVPADAPQYAKALELAKTAKDSDWKTDDPEGRPGIWVSYNLLFPHRGSGAFKPLPVPTAAELQVMVGADEWAKIPAPRS
jgi:hypothetical protein